MAQMIRKAPEHSVSEAIGQIPFRLALAGGWIDQPFVSRHDPKPPGSMVVVSVKPTFRWMDRSGICTSTRRVAMRLWEGVLPDRPPEVLVRELYEEENKDKADPSGSQDMIGLLYPGVNRLDYTISTHDGIFPAHIESNTDPAVARWLERVVHILPVAPRPDGYNPLGEKHFDPDWVRRLGQSGADCFDAIVQQNLTRLGDSFSECMRCWHHLLPQTVEHPVIQVDLLELLAAYQAAYPGAMYSGCGGGYLIVISEDPVPGAFQVEVRTC